MRYLVLGAGPAGVIAAETLRKVDPVGNVILVGDEPEPPYARMAIPYLLTDKIPEAGTYLRKGADHYAKLGITVKQDRAQSVDRKAKTVKLRSGDTLSYDKLLIATGSHPVKPPVPGLDLPGVHHCWTLADARAIASQTAKGQPVVLIGAGFIGCIILEALLERGAKLAVVEMADRMVARMMDKTAGDMIQAWCETKGAAIHVNAQVTAVTQKDGGLSVRLKDGKELPAKLVVAAAGVAPNVDFLEASGLASKSGIRVDNHLASADPDIFAAGDVAEGPDFGGGYSVHAIQPTAADHGRIAALNMAGRKTAYSGSLAMNVLDTAGLISCSFGHWNGVPGGQSAEALDQSNWRYIRLSFSGDKLVGALAVGHTDMIGALRGLIQTKRSLGVWKERLMADPQAIGAAFVSLSQS